MKALKCKTLSACVAWQVMVSSQIAHDDSEVQIHLDIYIQCLLNHKLIPLPSYLSAQNIMLKSYSYIIASVEFHWHMLAMCLAII